MPAYFEYMLKASVCLAIVYAFYILLLKRITYYKWNRFYLLIYSGLALIIPFINVSVFVESKQIDGLSFFSKMPSLQTNLSANTGSVIPGFDTYNLLVTFFAVGFFIMLCRLLVQLLSLKRLRSKAVLMQDGEVRLFHLSEPVLPFSFLNNIYLNKHNYSEKEFAEIVEHELVHVRQKHTVDMLMIECICILNWYNPFAWLLKKAVQENLEFIADGEVINKGADKKSYQYLLLKVTGEVTPGITNNLNFSSLKNRILMMNKAKTNRLHLLKFALLIPVITLLLLAFRNKHQEITGANKEQSILKTYILSSLTYSIPDTKVEAAVKKEQEKCLLKTGEALNLDLVYNERTRLKDLLEKNGYHNIGDHAITFMIDTTLGNNSFSIQININPAKSQLGQNKEQPDRSNDKAVTSGNSPDKFAIAVSSSRQPKTQNVSNNLNEDENDNANPKNSRSSVK